MSISSILNTATSGLLAAQTGLRTVSDNVANVNTPGYVRKLITQTTQSGDGGLNGTLVTGVKRAADAFLQAASQLATAKSSEADIKSSLLDRVQSFFGDPSKADSFLGGLNGVYSAFSVAANDPASSLKRTDSVSKVSGFLADANSILTSLNGLQPEIDARVSSDVDHVNDLLKQIDSLNSNIAQAKSSGGDSSGAEDQQDQAITQLSKLIHVTVTGRTSGGVNVRTSDGLSLAGDGPATLSYSPVKGAPGDLTLVTYGSTTPQSLRGRLDNGEIKGLLDLRDQELPGITEQLGELVTKATDELNRAHNAGSAVPAANTLTGRDTGLDLPTAVTGFTGKTSIAITNAAGVIQRRVDIDFGANTYSIDGGAATGFTPANFLAALNTGLSGFGSASFSGRALSLSATASTSGVAISDDATTPSSKTGRGFSHYFGLNDLVSSAGITNYATGLTGSSPHGFTPGSTLSLRLTDRAGGKLQDVTVTVPAATTVQDLINSLNSSTTGVGIYGQYSLDADGRLAFAPINGSGAVASVLQDTTARGAGGPSVSSLFGLGSAERSARVSRLSVRSDIASNGSKLALAKINLSVTPGQPALGNGDGRNGTALANAGATTTAFDAAGGFAAANRTVTQYASQFGGAIGRAAATADAQKTSAAAILTEVNTRRSSVEGVNLDEELVSLTTYQQAFNASARLIQAAQSVYDTLISIVK